MKTARGNNRRVKGFTLIELMMVVAIIGILAAIAIPSYRQHIISTNRSDAMAVLQTAAQGMERYYAQSPTNSYAGATRGTHFPAGAPLDGARLYDITVDVPDDSPNTYTLTATPVAGSSQDGDGIIEITNTGLRRWDRNDNGAWDTNELSWKKH